MSDRPAPLPALTTFWALSHSSTKLKPLSQQTIFWVFLD
jgi:hypothetical protein